MSFIELFSTVLSLAKASLDLFAMLFFAGIAFLLVMLIFMYVVDISQTKHAIRHNYPIIGRFRYLFEFLGEFFRQYFFAQDREEQPFNRAQRSWVYRAAKNIDSTAAFGSTKDLRIPGTFYFANCTFPILELDAVLPSPVIIGPYCLHPYSVSEFFHISGMSFGALSAPAIKALSRGAAMSNIWLNTGEGGLSEYHLSGGCDVVFQIGTAKYGVRNEKGELSHDKLRELAAMPQIKMFELKLSQGAKPGKGGILPANKVTGEIAKIRLIPIGQSSLSPNRHPEVYDELSLLEMLNLIRDITHKPVGFKTAIGSYEWLEKLCQVILKYGIEKAPDFITIDGAEGGSGAAPMSLMDNMGLPIRDSLPIVVDILRQYGLKDRIKVIASGKLINPSDVAFALCAGADFAVSARGFMFSLGCIQAMQCNKNTCPTGVTTHNKKLQEGLDPTDKAVRVMHYAKNLREEVNMIAHSCGLTDPRKFNRKHVRIVGENTRSLRLDEIFPEKV